MPARSRPLLGVARRGSRHGIWVAAAAFVPTFLATFFGILYLAGLSMTSRSPAGVRHSTPPVVSSRAPESGAGGGPWKEAVPSQMRATQAADLVDAARSASLPARESRGTAAVPAITPA